MAYISLFRFSISLSIVVAIIIHFTSATPIMAGGNESSIDRLNHQIEIYPQEKLHVVTDRDLYFGGDTVWFRIFVVDAATHRQMAISKYAYVEMLSPFGEVKNRIKVIERDGIYAGYIPVDEDIYEGDYTLAAYTMYSENQGKDYFFRKPIRLLDQHSSKYVIDSEFTPVAPGEVKGSFKVRSINGDKMNYNKMSWIMHDGKFLEMPGSKNGFSRKFKRDKGEDVVLVKFGDYGRYFNIEFPVEKIDISFYPEGGWLVAGDPCTVAFKATDENGKGIYTSGIIRNDYGEKVAEFTTTHKGMGDVIFVPEANCIYTAEYPNPKGELQTTVIGTPNQDATVLRYHATGSKGFFSVAGNDLRDLELIVALHGKGVLATPISSVNPLSFEKKDLPAGLYQALLVSKTDSIVLSERIFFIGADRLTPGVSGLSTDSVSIIIEAPQGIGGDCSVRITNLDIIPDSRDIDIRSQFLLQSELRGRIEDPSYYFSKADRETDRNLDLLMMVNGWCRYNLPEVVRGRLEEPKIPLEIGQEIIGQVRSRWKGSPMEGVMVSAIAPKLNFGTFADTDNNGFFHLNGFDFPEGTSFILRAMNEKGGNESNYEIYNEKFPIIDLIRETPEYVSSIKASDFFKGIHWTMLDEIKVQVFKNDKLDIFQSLATYYTTSEDMFKRGVSSLEQALRTFPGMTKKQNRFLWRSQYVAYYIDGTLYETSDGSISTPKASPPGSLPGTYHNSRFATPQSSQISNHERKVQNLKSRMAPTAATNSSAPTISDIEDVIPFHAIERIEFIRPELFVMGNQYGGGVIMITSKSGSDMHWSKQFELKDHLPLGYQEYKEYSSPLLAVDADEYDLQTHPTLLWIPSIKFDGTGKAIDLNFPLRSNHRIIIEGLTDTGDIISEIL